MDGEISSIGEWMIYPLSIYTRAGLIVLDVS
jgi:hypothetical protein